MLPERNLSSKCKLRSALAWYGYTEIHCILYDLELHKENTTLYTILASIHKHEAIALHSLTLVSSGSSSATLSPMVRNHDLACTDAELRGRRDPTKQGRQPCAVDDDKILTSGVW